jgi:hypothetical protein
VDQLLAVAWAMVAVHAVLALVMGYLVFGRVLRVSAWPTIRATIPSGLAGGAAVLTGAALPALAGSDLALIPLFLVTAGAAGTVAGTVLLSLDGEARRWLGMALYKLRVRGEPG